MHSVLRPPLLPHARCVSNQLAYTSHLSPTLTQEHSADHRPVAIAAVCAIAATSVQMRFHVRAIAPSSRIVGPGVRSRKKPVPVPVPCRRCALHHHALHLPLASRGATSCLPRAQRRPTPAIWRSTLRILRDRLVLRLCQFSEGRGLRLASHTQASQDIQIDGSSFSISK